MAEISATVARGGWLGYVAAWAHHRYSSWALGAIAFADSDWNRKKTSVATTVRPATNPHHNPTTPIFR